MLKALLPFFIVTHHTYLFQYDFNQAGVFVVALFFFVSGYGLESKRLKSGVSVKALPKTLYKLVLPLISPIIIFAALSFFIKDASMWSLITHEPLYKVVLPFTWFIITLLILYVIFYGVAGIVGNKRFLWVATIAVVAFSAVGFVLKMPSTYHQTTSGFLAGILYKHIEPTIISWSQKHNVKALIGFICSMIILTALCQHPLENGEYPRVYALSFLWPITAVVMISRLPEIKNKVVDFFAGISYELYICQGIAFMLLPKDMIDNRWLYLVCIFVLDIAIAWGCKRVMGMVVRN